MLILRNCRLIPALTEGTALTCADVQLDGDKIAAIAPCGAVFDGPAEELDLRGATLMPGLINAHLHLPMMGPYDELSLAAGKPCAITLNCLLSAQYYLDNGYTTVREMCDYDAGPVKALRDYINAGLLTGPRILCAGPALTPNAVPCQEMDLLRVSGPLDARERVRWCIQKGYDFIKLFGSSNLLLPRELLDMMTMEPDEIQEAARVANARGSYCAIHMHSGLGCDISARAGVRTIEHASFIRPETLEYLEAHKAEGQGIVPTLSLLADPALRIGTRPDVRERVVEHLGRAREFDLLIGWGTDTGLKFSRENPYVEFQLRHDELGFSNLQILQQVTIHSARLLRQGERLGTVKPGKLADLIAVEGDPAADLSALYKKPLHVIKGGVLIR